MAKRRHTVPLLVAKGEAVRLRRVRFAERAFDEGWLQKLLFEHPTLIPVDEIEPAFGPLAPVAREVPTQAGPLDLLFVNPEGYPTLVETKLWRSPEARREVVSQIIDYAKEFAGWSYEELAQAVARATGLPAKPDPLWAIVQGEEDADPQSFVETLSRNLARGQFLLLIVGDGIRQGVERMAAYLQQTPSLNFTLALVEMAVFRIDPDKREPPLVQPRIVARTQEVVRAIVRIEGEAPAGSKISVEFPEEEPAGGGGRTTITEEAFYEQLAKNRHAGQEGVAFVKDVLIAVERIGVGVDWKSSGPAIKYVDNDSGNRFSFGAILKGNGRIALAWLRKQCRRAGIPSEIATQYFDTISGWIPAATRAKAGLGHLFVRDMIPHRDAWLRLIEETVAKIRAALAEAD